MAFCATLIESPTGGEDYPRNSKSVFPRNALSTKEATVTATTFATVKKLNSGGEKFN